MEGIVLLGHGSRIPGAGGDMERIAVLLREKFHHTIVEVGYMARLPPHVPEAFAHCVAQGATRIVVIPYFLHSGLHMCRDIPELLRTEVEKYPQVEVVLGPNLGFDDSLVDLVEKRISAAAGLPSLAAQQANA